MVLSSQYKSFLFLLWHLSKAYHLENIGIAHLFSEAFTGFEDANSLWLQKNKLTSLEPGTFKILASLQLLNLCGNKMLTNINPKAFKGLTRLRELILDWNQLLPEKNIEEIRRTLPGVKVTAKKVVARIIS